MSVPTAELGALSLALLSAIAGSLHCVGMCGPLRWLSAERSRGGLAYHLGRGAAYACAGAAAGALGTALPFGLALLLVAAAVGLSLWEHKLPAFGSWRARALRSASARPWLLGLASGLLPCGLLHGWVAAAALSGGAGRGALLLGTLWLGTLPALEASVKALRRPLERLRLRFPRALPLAILLLALVPLLLRSPWAALPHGHAPGATQEKHSGHGE